MEGCLSYRFYKDPEVPNDFVFVEEWESQEILEQHHKEPHFKAFSQQLADFLTSKPGVKVHEVIRTKLG